YDQVFWRGLSLKLVLFTAGFVLSAGYLMLNFWYIYRHYSVLRWHIGLDVERSTPAEMELTPERLRVIAIGASILIGMFFAAHFSSLYDLFLRFINGSSVGIEDPIFGRDIAFYLLRLPFLDALQSIALTLSLLTIAHSIGTYVWMG